jgi:hypothetical protein
LIKLLKNQLITKEQVKKWFTWRFDRDNNYYFGLTLLVLGILSLGVYLLFDLLGIFDAFEPVSFLITFLIGGWGFVLLWKSDNDYRFKQAQKKILELEQRLAYSRLFIVPPRQLKRSKR